MAKKKSEEKKEDKTSQKKTTKPKVINNQNITIEKYSISELLEKNKIKPLRAVGFLEYYGLTEDFKKEIEMNKVVSKFSDGEFRDMYERYIRRGI